MFTIKKLMRNKTNIANLFKSREHRVNSFYVTYTKKSFGKRFVDYSGPNFFNQLPTISKKNINYGLMNDKTVVYNCLFSELIIS